jgi:predicted nucleic acid-binding protein
MWYAAPGRRRLSTRVSGEPGTGLWTRTKICEHAFTLAELSAAPHEVRRDDEQDAYDEHAERARRLEILQRAESEFDPIPFGAEAARIFGRVTAAVIAAGRKPRGRAVDLMIAATAIAEGLPLYTTNPADFTGLGALIRVVPVTRPPVPHEPAAR